MPKTILSKTKNFLRQKIQKWKICLRQKKPRLVADFTLDHTGVQYTMYPSTARGSSLAVNDRTMDVRVTSDRSSTP